MFTKEDKKDDVLPVLDLKQRVHRKDSPCIKKGIIKGFADRARALCDDQHLEDELKNVEDVFVANGYDGKVVKPYMKANYRGEREIEEQQYGGKVVVPYIRGMSEQFKRLALKYCFQTVLKPGKKIKELKTKSQQPLGEKKKGFILTIVLPD